MEKWKDTILNAEADPWTSTFTDHRALLITARIKLKKTQAHLQRRAKYMKCTGLVAQAYGDSLRDTAGQSTDEIEYKSALRSMAARHIPEESRRPKQEYIKPATLELISEYRNLSTQGWSN